MKNWKTTACGAITAAGVGMSQSDNPTIKMIGQVLMVVGPLLMGFVAKDFNVTGK